MRPTSLAHEWYPESIEAHPFETEIMFENKKREIYAMKRLSVLIPRDQPHPAADRFNERNALAGAIARRPAASN